ncbi:MAG: C-type lectin domain-containing protein [Acidimicrobiia bacterium]|nr:C-type lectin domain-containing protein [Acidimicrobiia bacterium]
MTLRTRTLAAGILLAVLAPLTALASTPTSPVLKVQDELEGRIYQVYEADGISWEDADAFAKSVVINDVAGHLATITSEGEDAFIDMLRNQAVLHPPEAWVGGEQLDGSTEPGAGWVWINSEGPIATPDVPLPSYSNWLPGEPNDQNTETYLAVGLRGEFGWNDEQALGNIGGFIVEFDAVTTIDPGECQEQAGCETTSGQTVEYPPEAIFEDAEIGIKTFEFTDDLVNRCGQVPLVLFADDGIPDNEVTIPPYLCGSPKFLLVRVEASGIELLDGTVLVENSVEQALPNNLFDCTGPFDDLGLPAGSPYLIDPQNRDKVTYQTTNPAEMLETDIGATVDPLYEGSLSEVTFECGSSRGKIKSNSYFGIGLSINFGDGFDLGTNPDANRDAFARLTLYKLLVLQAAVLESKPALEDTFLQRIGYKVLKRLVRAAIRKHTAERYDAALFKIRLFEWVAENLEYDEIPNENYRGEHLMRAGNIGFMYTESVIPFN